MAKDSYFRKWQNFAKSGHIDCNLWRNTIGWKKQKGVRSGMEIEHVCCKKLSANFAL